MNSGNLKKILKELTTGRLKILFIGIALIIGISLLAWVYSTINTDRNINLSGRLEGYETNIAPKYGGRIAYVSGREGKHILKNDLIIKIEDSELQASLKSAIATLDIANNQVKQSEAQLNIIKNQINQALSNLNKTKQDSSGQILTSKNDLAVAEKTYSQVWEQLKQAESDYKFLSLTYKRLKNLSVNGSVSKQDLDLAESNLNIATANYEIKKQEMSISQNRIKMAEGGLLRSNSSIYASEEKKEQLNILYNQLKQSYSQFRSAKSNVIRAKADIQQISAKIDYMNIKSPISGIITSRTVEPGEIVTSGQTLLTLLDYNTIYMRGFIPEGEIGKIKIGQKAEVYLDSFPKNPLTAFVSEIDSIASFTPENIYFKNERVKQVFGIKLQIKNPAGLAKPGMPADAIILFEDK